MKIKWKERMKNPYFWCGLIAVILAAMGIEAETLISWDELKTAFSMLFCNPYKIGAVIMAILGVFVDPTTSGVTDG